MRIILLLALILFAKTLPALAEEPANDFEKDRLRAITAIVVLWETCYSARGDVDKISATLAPGQSTSLPEFKTEIAERFRFGQSGDLRVWNLPPDVKGALVVRGKNDSCSVMLGQIDTQAVIAGIKAFGENNEFFNFALTDTKVKEIRGGQDKLTTAKLDIVPIGLLKEKIAKQGHSTNAIHSLVVTTNESPATFPRAIISLARK